MSRKYLYYSLISILIIVSILGLFIVLSNKGKSDAVKFKEEYENYNKSNLKVNIDKNNPFVYRDEKQIKKILKNNTGMIYLGTANDDNSRLVVNTILPLAKSNDVKKIFYLDTSKITDKSLKKYKDNNICVIFIISGEVIASYTKEEFKDSNTKKEINYYMQQTFNDYCDETCND